MEPVVVSFAIGEEFSLATAEDIIRFAMERPVAPFVDGAIHPTIIPEGHTEPGSDKDWKYNDETGKWEGTPPKLLDVPCSVYTFYYAITPSEAKSVAKAINDRASSGELIPGSYAEDMMTESFFKTLAPGQVIQVKGDGLWAYDAYAKELVRLGGE